MTSPVERVPSEEELASIRARADVATPGPWSAADEHGDIPGAEPAWCVSRMGGTVNPGGYMYDIAYVVSDDMSARLGEPTADAEFIAAARSDVPRLVEAVRVLQGQVERALEKGRSDAKKVHDVELLHVWTNEDGKRFVFADDLAVALRIPGALDAQAVS